VIEHIDPQLGPDVVRTVADAVRPGGWLLWTAARPGQGGVGHINCRPKEYWRTLLEGSGLTYAPVLTNGMVQHCLDGAHMGWFLNNAMIFYKPTGDK
jgi:hypothetical protein